MPPARVASPFCFFWFDLFVSSPDAASACWSDGSGRVGRVLLLDFCGWVLGTGGLKFCDWTSVLDPGPVLYLDFTFSLLRSRVRIFLFFRLYLCLAVIHHHLRSLTLISRL